MTDFTAVNKEVQKLINAAVLAQKNTDATALAALQAQFDAYKASHPDVVTPPPPPSFVWPDATNTGVPAGTVLTNYTGPAVITTPNTIIDSKTIPFSLTIKASGVLIKNSKITTSDWTAISAEGFVVTVQNCELNGLGGTAGSYAINGGCIATQNKIYNFENGIAPESNSTIKGNYIYGLQAGGSDPHYDGVALHGGMTNVLIEDNTIAGRDNACVWITNDFGSISNVTVNHNKCLAAAYGTGPNANPPVYTIYVDGRKPNGTITGISITNNLVQKGIYGSIEIESAGVTASGNTDLNGNPISIGM